jgi:NAD+ synthase
MLKDIVKWISDYSKNNNLSPLVVGISGGIDSALVSALCAMTGIDTLVVSLPIYQKDDQLLRARNHAKWLSEKYDNVEFIEKDLSGLFENFKSIFSENEMNGLSLANSRSRLRMVTLYQMAGSKGGMVIGTGNRVEDFGVGFFTKYGDGGVDISPIGDLTKTQVRNLSSELGIIKEIILADPTDGLWEEDRTDEQQLGATYEELEWAMNFLGDPINLNKRQGEVYEIYSKFNRINRHKMIGIPVFKIIK